MDDVYRSLDYFSRYSEELQKHLYQKVQDWVEFNDELGYYDVTNYYFEIPYNDEDVYDGYVYGQSILGGDKEFKKWVLKKTGTR